MNNFRHFRFWCQKVLPLVYDESLSYYEVLCKVVTYINKLIEDGKMVEDALEEIQKELAIIQDLIDNFDTKVVETIIEDSLLKMIIVGINDDGYIVYYIPDSWDDIQFGTTGLDTVVSDVDYGHLVLSY